MTDNSEPSFSVLPFFVRRPTTSAGATQLVHRTIAQDVLASAESFATSVGQPLVDVLTGAFASFLRRYAVQPETVFSAHGRQISVDVTNSLTFNELLLRVADLLGRVRPLDEDVLPLLFDFRSGSSDVHSEMDASPHDLHVVVHHQLSELSMDWIYRSDLFERSYVLQMARHFEQLLIAALDRPDVPIMTIDYLTSDDKEAIRSHWNVERTPYQRVSVARMFEQQAHVSPDAIAIEFGPDRLSYSELDFQANQLAHTLIDSGVGVGCMVGLCLDRSVEMIVAVVAAFKAGGVVVPLDSTYPDDRLQFMIDDAKIDVLVSSRELVDRVPALGASEVTRLLVDEHKAVIEAHPGSRPNVVLPAEAAAYCIYTSGSTGAPKGAVVEHGALANLVAWHADTWLVEPELRTLLYSPISFDVAFHEIVAGLCTGATLVQLDDDTRRNPLALLEFVRTARIEKWYLPFNTLQQIAQAARSAEAPTNLRELIVGGEVLRITPEIRDLARRTNCVIHNHYGSTECIDVATHSLSGDPAEWPDVAPIGRASVHNMNLYILDDLKQLVPVGVVGEIHGEGDCLAREYHGRPELSAERFTPSPFNVQGRVLYRLGDLGRYLPDGTIECLGRADTQVKIRGFRVEPSEVETTLASHDAVAECVVAVKAKASGGVRLIAYVVAAAGVDLSALSDELRTYLGERLPFYMVPSAVVLLDALPLTPSGKVAVRSLPEPSDAPQSETVVSGDVRQIVTQIWSEILQLSSVDGQKSFFDLGGDSISIVQVHQRIESELGRSLPIDALFRFPTLDALVAELEMKKPVHSSETQATKRSDGSDVAIIGISCRVPGAQNVDEFWRNIRGGVESIERLKDHEVYRLESDQISDRHFVPMAAMVPETDRFDASFFGYSQAEAALIDPQQRLFLEASWAAIESAGVDPAKLRVGMFAGASLNTYLTNNVLPATLGNRPFLSHRQFDRSTDLRIEQGNAGDHLATRVSFKLNLRGPSVNVQTTCSTSLVAVHMARQAILTNDCDVALAGGVSIVTPQNTGYLWRDEMMLSPDGHIRPFDEAAAGTVFGNGLGVVVLKRLDAAIADGDHIYAVIKGSAVNNDGAEKMDYSGPSVKAQAEVIARAHAIAGIRADEISYVETHGTGTKLGDPIEIAGLKEAFAQSANREGRYCAIGSVKPNIGHLDEAAGVVGLIKAALSVYHQELPPSINFKNPNPLAELRNSPFYVNTELRDWKSKGAPRRAGVSSFGMGGTNCHVVLEDAPKPRAVVDRVERRLHVIPISGRSNESLQANANAYLNAISKDVDLGDFAYSVSTGRRHFGLRSAIVARDNVEARRELAMLVDSGVAASHITKPKLGFLFTGQGSQYVGMGKAFYDCEPVFRSVVDECGELLGSSVKCSLIELLFENDATSRLNRTENAQPALFIIEYALSKLWESWGVEPEIVLGHSLGEIVAACVAGVFTLPDALRLVVARGELMGRLPSGAMAQVSMGPDELNCFLTNCENVAIASVNSANSTVISGDVSSVGQVCKALRATGTESIPLVVSHAFHSPMMQPMLDEFHNVAKSINYAEPIRTIISNVTGRVAQVRELSNPEYWVRHIVSPVQFADAVTLSAELGVSTYVEIGPKPTLSNLGRQNVLDSGVRWLPSITPRNPLVAYDSLGTLYTDGVDVDWNAFHAPFFRRRIPAPTYVFSDERHWIEARHVPDGLGCFDVTWESVASRLQAEIPRIAILRRDRHEQELAELLGATICSSADVPKASRLVFVVKAFDEFNTASEVTATLLEARMAVESAIQNSAESIWFVSCGEMNGAASASLGMIHSALASLVKTFIEEHPELPCVALRVETFADVATWLSRDPSSEPELVVHGNRAEAPRLKASGPAKRQSLSVDESGTYLVTGGASGIGRELAKHLLKSGAGKVVVVARNTELPLELRRPNCELFKADVSDLAQVQHVVSSIGPKLRGVFHCAGVLDDGALIRQTPEQFSQVLAPKVSGAWNLHQSTLSSQLDFFVVFSSLASVVGYRGQGAYAAANGFMDGLTRHRRSIGLPALSVSWGSWANVGMSSRLSDDHRQRVVDEGESFIRPDMGIESLGGMLSSAKPHIVAANIDWNRFVASRGRLSPILGLVAQNMATATTDPPASVPPASDRGQVPLREMLLQSLADVLGSGAPVVIDEQRGFSDMGLDSLAALDLRRRLQNDLKIDLPVTLAFDYPNVSDLLEYLDDRLADSIQPEEVKDNEVTAPERSVAIIGMSCRFPGANTPDRFWHLLRAGHDAVAEIPQSRWIADEYYDETGSIEGWMYVRTGAFIDDVDCFDAKFFGIAPREAENMDPRQRLLLEETWQAIRSAGLEPETLRGSKTGVYLGCDEFTNDYLRHAESGVDAGQYLATGTTLSFTAGRISYQLGVHGPSIVMATACSSSLVALHSAVRAIRDGDCDLAIVGGAKLMLSPEETMQLCKLKALAPDGRSKVFSANADGFGRGEGAAVVVLKRADLAEADGDPIVAVVRGSAVNHDGPSSGLTVPSGRAQVQLLQAAMHDAQIEPNEIGYIEAHGTGTQLGDPIELNALGQVFTDCAQPVFVGSVKANIGHLEEAAGLAGLIKAVLVLRHKVVPPQIQCKELSDKVDWSQLPLEVARQEVPWSRNSRVAGVSSFGMSGTNAHVIVEAYSGLTPKRSPLPRYEFKRVRHWVERRGQSVSNQRSEELTQDMEPKNVNGEVQDSIRSHVATLLGYQVDEVPVNMPLDDLGADSLTFMRVIQFLRDRWNVVTSFQQLVEDASTVTDIARMVVSKTSDSAGASIDKGTKSSDVASSKSRTGPSELTQTVPAWEELTAVQRTFVAGVVEAYAKQTSRSKSAAGRDRSVLANCRMLPFRDLLKELSYPIVVDHSAGSRFWDIDGNEYLDISMGYGVHMFGHSPQFVVDALRSQLDSGIHIGPQDRHAGEVARLLCELTGMDRAVFSNSGTEAVMAALRFARAATNRTRFVMFEGSYHGWSDNTLALPAGTTTSIPMSRGIGAGAMNDVVVLEYGTEESLAIIQSLGHELAGVLVEPVQSRRPDLQPVAFLKKLRDLTRDSGAALIFDEVITGFRVAPGGAQEWLGVRADLVTYGKILGGGLPIGAVAGSAKFIDTIDGGAWSYGDDSSPTVSTTFFGGTFNKNPMSMAAARSVLRHVTNDGGKTQRLVADRTERLAGAFNSFCESEKFPMRMVCFSSLFRFIGEGDYRLQRFPLAIDLFFHMLAHKGIYVLETRVCFLSSSHTDADVDRIMEAATSCLQELRAAGFFPSARSASYEAPSGVAAVSHAQRFERDAQLPVTFDVQDRVAPSEYRDVLLTGATGFLGAYLARDLLERTNAKLHCIVRSDDDEHAHRRVVEALDAIGMTTDAISRRIVGIAGDLGASQLGLCPEVRRSLAFRIDAIFHNGAHVDSLLSYEKLRSANVEATKSLLELAVEGPAKEFHYVSSDAVFDSYGYFRQAVAYEDEPLGHAETLFGGYAQTKWVSDTMVANARAAGLHASIYRPGTIIGATNGQGEPDDYFARFLRGVVQLGVAPEISATFDFMPVDVVSSMIVESSQFARSGGVFHIVNPEPIDYPALITGLQRASGDLEVVPIHEWENRISALRFEDGNPLYTILPLFLNSSEPLFRQMRLDTSNSVASAPALFKQCPSVSDLLSEYLDRVRSARFLQPSVPRITRQ